MSDTTEYFIHSPLESSQYCDAVEIGPKIKQGQRTEKASPQRRITGAKGTDVVTFNRFTFERTKLTDADRIAIQQAIKFSP